ncbi:MAG: rod shape-determining protein MreC [Planctomycetota bacterium]|nr:MAG: rod shape-determining protein MreC [Planctomycetota bacterium]
MRRLIIAAVILMLLAVILGLTGALVGLWSPFAQYADRWRAGFHGLGTEDISDQQREVDDQVRRLQAENNQLRQRLREYQSMDSEIGTRIFPEQLLRARVVARSAEHGRHFLEIDRGALQGVHVGDPVVVGWTLVGVVRGERANRSLVQLLSDTESRIAVSLFDPASLKGNDEAAPLLPVAQGVIAGTGDRHGLRVVHVEARSGIQIRTGLQVLTSGLDERIPFGLIIGEVVEARPRADSDLWDIEVAPARPWGSYPTVVALRRLEALSQVP